MKIIANFHSGLFSTVSDGFKEITFAPTIPRRKGQTKQDQLGRNPRN